MRTTIDLADPLFREVKTRAVQQGVKLKDLLARYIEAGLRNQSAPPDPSQPRQRSSFPIAIPHVPGSAATSALTNSDLYSTLDDEDAKRFRKLSGE